LNPYRKLGGQTLVYGLGSIIPRFLNYAILTPYYTYKFAVEDYGIITELYAYVAVLLVILTYGLETGFFKFSADRKKSNDIFSISAISLFATSSLFVVLIFVFIGKISAMMGYGSRQEYIKWLAVIIALDAFTSIFYARLRMQEKVMKFAVYKILGVGINILLIIFFLEMMPRISEAYRGKWIDVIYNRETGVGYVLVANMLASILVCLLLITNLGKITLRFNFRLYAKILGYSFPLLVAGLAGILNETIDRILLRHFLSADYNILHELGIYGANYKIAVFMTIFIQMFRFAADPFFFSNYRKKNSNEIFGNILKYFVIFCMIIFLFIVLYIDIIKYFISSRYHEGLSIVPIVLIANVLVGISFNINFWYKLSGKTQYAALIIGTGAIITIVMNIIFIPVYSYKACAYSHLASNFVMLIFSYLLGRQLYRIEYDIKRILFYILSGLAIYFVNMLLKTDNVLYNILIGSALFIPFVYFVQRKEKLFSVFIKGYEDKDSQ
jgi:O-antigen/teichoic acid export membrane protein